MFCNAMIEPPPKKARRVSREKSTTGDAARRSQIGNTMSSTTPMPPSHHAALPDICSATMVIVRPAARSALPGQSNGRPHGDGAPVQAA